MAVVRARARARTQRPRLQALGQRQLQLPGGHEPALPLVPNVQQLLRGRGADQPRVGDAGEAHARDVAAGAVDALEIPDRLLNCLGYLI